MMKSCNTFQTVATVVSNAATVSIIQINLNYLSSTRSIGRITALSDELILMQSTRSSELKNNRLLMLLVGLHQCSID